MNKKISFLGILFFLYANLFSQTIKGTLSAHAGQEIALTGFNYLESYVLSQSKVDSLGNFSLNYPAHYNGMGILQTKDQNSLLIALTETNITIEGTHLKDLSSLRFINSPNNVAFGEFVDQNIQNQQAYQAWRYLQPLYATKTHLKGQKNVIKTLNTEIKRIENADEVALKAFAKDNFLRWYLPKQLLVNGMPSAPSSYPERITKYIQEFRSTDFNNPNFKNSGVLKDLLEGHYMLLENMGQPLETIYAQMNQSTDYLILNLKNNNSLLNIVSKHLFTFLESRSLFTAADYLANRVLGDSNCNIDANTAFRLEKYRRLKEGNIAPDIQLSATKKLSTINKNIVLVFGASWCTHCKDELTALKQYYVTWKNSNLNVEVVYISLDEKEEAFNSFYSVNPWPTYCDYKGWESAVVKDYAIYATPTYFLLDKDLKILKHPTGLGHVNVLVNSFTKN